MRLRGADIDVRLRMGKRRPAAYRELRREREEEIARLQAAGFTLNGIAERLGMSEGGVMQALGRLRRAGRELPNGRAELARRRERAVTRGLRRGSAPAEIAAELGVSTGTVHHIIQRLRSRGVELPPTGRAVARARAQRIVELRRRSMKLREIGEIVGLTTGGVNSVLRRHRAASLASAGERKFGGTHR